jgi:hypothetical protein
MPALLLGVADVPEGEGRSGSDLSEDGPVDHV